MNVYFVATEPYECDIDYESLWILWQLHLKGFVEDVKVRCKSPQGEILYVRMFYLDSERTFEAAIRELYPTIPPPDSTERDTDPPSTLRSREFGR